MNEIQEHCDYTGQVEDIRNDKLKYASEVGDDLTKTTNAGLNGSMKLISNLTNTKSNNSMIIYFIKYLK